MSKFLVLIVHGAPLEKQAGLSTPEKKNISEMSKQQPKDQGLQIMPGHTITLLTLKTLLITDKGGFRIRKKLEAWHIKQTPNADNNSCPLPGQYNIIILFNKHS